MIAFQNVVVNDIFHVGQDVREACDFFLIKILQLINTPGYLTPRVVVIPTINGPIVALGDLDIGISVSSMAHAYYFWRTKIHILGLSLRKSRNPLI